VERHGAADLDIDALGRPAAAENLRPEDLAAVRIDGEDDRSRPALGSIVRVDADPGGEAIDRVGRCDRDVSDRMRAEAVGEAAPADRQGRPDDRPIALEPLEVLPDELED